MKTYILPHLKIKSRQVPKYVLLPGDPNRVDLIGTQLEKFEILNQNREFKTGIGLFNGIRILVCSTGIGCPSTAIATEELIDAGASVLIRVGTCGGGWKANISVGSFIIPCASIRDEGTTIEYIPTGFPAVADFDILHALIKSSKENNEKYFVGINRTHDSFYGSQNSVTKWGEYLRDDKWAKYDTPILSSDMECSALFVLASLKGVKAGAILLANAEPESLRKRLNKINQKVKTSDLNKRDEEKYINIQTKIVLHSVEILNKESLFESSSAY